LKDSDTKLKIDHHWITKTSIPIKYDIPTQYNTSN